MKIVKLEPSKHKDGRWLVGMEDGSLLRVGEGDVVSLSLYSGKELDEPAADALAAAASRNKLRERAVALLSGRSMSKKELVDKLSAPPRPRKRQEGVTADGAGCDADPELRQRQRQALREEAEAVAEWLAGLGLLDDEAYARAVAQHYCAKGYGARKIRDELYRRGVPRTYWDEALTEAEAEDSAVDRLLARKLRGAEPTRENMKRASEYLARRGFGWDEISAAIERFQAGQEE